MFKFGFDIRKLMKTNTGMHGKFIFARKVEIRYFIVMFYFCPQSKTNEIGTESCAVLFIDEFYFEQCGYLIYSGEL